MAAIAVRVGAQCQSWKAGRGGGAISLPHYHLQRGALPCRGFVPTLEDVPFTVLHITVSCKLPLS